MVLNSVSLPSFLLSFHLHTSPFYFQMLGIWSLVVPGTAWGTLKWLLQMSCLRSWGCWICSTGFFCFSLITNNQVGKHKDWIWLRPYFPSYIQWFCMCQSRRYFQNRENTLFWCEKQVGDILDESSGCLCSIRKVNIDPCPPQATFPSFCNPQHCPCS